MIQTVNRIEDLPDEPPAATYVLIDVYRFSTTVAYLLDAGAAAVKPFQDADAARDWKAETGGILFGEHEGKKMDGFDHTNSPVAAQNASVAGKKVGIRTTNGTRALDRIKHFDVLIGSTVNAGAVAAALPDDEDVVLLAVGTEGHESPEDLIGADIIRQHTMRAPNASEKRFYEETMRASPYTKRLQRLGAKDDIAAAMRFDALDVVPVLDGGTIVDR